MHFYRIALVVSTLSFVWSCSSQSIRPMDRERYLDSFIGQSPAYIETHLNLSQLGYQSPHQVKSSASQLEFIVQRPITIPTPITRVGGLQVDPRTLNHSNNYDTQLQCRIVYQIQNQVATSVRYTGRTC